MVTLPIEFDVCGKPALTCAVDKEGGVTLCRSNGDLEATGKISIVGGKYRVTTHSLGVDGPLIFQIESFLNESTQNP